MHRLLLRLEETHDGIADRNLVHSPGVRAANHRGCGTAGTARRGAEILADNADLAIDESQLLKNSHSAIAEFLGPSLGYTRQAPPPFPCRTCELDVGDSRGKDNLLAVALPLKTTGIRTELRPPQESPAEADFGFIEDE